MKRTEPMVVESCDVKHWNNPTNGNRGFTLKWSSDQGFGEYVFWQEKDGKWRYDAEMMLQEDVVAAFAHFVSTIRREDA